MRRDLHRRIAKLHHAVSSGVLFEDRGIEFSRLQRLGPELLEYLTIDPFSPRAIKRFRQYLTARQKLISYGLGVWVASLSLILEPFCDRLVLL